MDELRKEIERKKRRLEEMSVTAPDKKFFRKGELEAKQAEEYWAKRESFNESLQHNGSTSWIVRQRKGGNEKEVILPRKEVIIRLRERNEPIRYFGESDYDAFQRLKQLEILRPEILKGFKNDLKDAMDKVDQAYLEEIVKQSGSTEEGSEKKIRAADVKIKESLTWEQITDMIEKGGESGENPKHDCNIILQYIKMILNVWATKLNARELDVKLSVKGKLATATYTQTVTYIRPLMTRLKKISLPEGQLECLIDIIRSVLKRNYIHANEAYLEMAIGNAPWPIGVTMVGIHARPGREKVSCKYVGHVLNDETQRKYIQALKRLILVTQKLFPTNPSLSVNYDAKHAAMTNSMTAFDI